MLMTVSLYRKTKRKYVQLSGPILSALISCKRIITLSVGQRDLGDLGHVHLVVDNDKRDQIMNKFRNVQREQRKYSAQHSKK